MEAHGGLYSRLRGVVAHVPEDVFGKETPHVFFFEQEGVRLPGEYVRLFVVEVGGEHLQGDDWLFRLLALYGSVLQVAEGERSFAFYPGQIVEQTAKPVGEQRSLWCAGLPTADAQ